MTNSTTLYVSSTVTEGPVTILPTHADTTMIQVITTAAPSSSDSVIIPVVIFVILLTVTIVGIWLYWYLCHNKGAYRTTGELAPGEDPEEDYSNRDASQKKEYYI